jgi:hypothetical protein
MKTICIVIAILATVCITVPGLPTASARPNIDIKWAAGGQPVVVTEAGYHTAFGGTVVGCVGSAELTLPTGAQTLAPGVSLGSDSCSSGNPACIPYQALSPRVTCQQANSIPSYWIHSPGSVSTSIENAQTGCLRAFWIVWDTDGNPNTPGTPGSDGYEEWIGPLVGFVPANPDGSLPC